jgi:small GTP-binding protein
MTDCWTASPKDRPTFEALCRRLAEFEAPGFDEYVRRISPPDLLVQSPSRPPPAPGPLPPFGKAPLRSSSDRDTGPKAKVVFAGSLSVGKTRIIRCASVGLFDAKPSPTIAAQATEMVVGVGVGGVHVRLTVWDTAGQERYQSITRTYFRNARVGVLVFAVDDTESVQRVLQYASDLADGAMNPIKIVVANKIDLEETRHVSKEQGAQLAKQLKAHYMEVSAKTGEGICDLFSLIADEVANNTVMACSRESQLEISGKNPNSAGRNGRCC